MRNGAAPYAAVACSVAAVMSGINLAAPLYPLYQAELRFSSLVLLMTYSVHVCGVLTGLTAIAAVHADRRRRALLFVAMAIAAAGSVTMATVTTTEQLLAGRFVQGIALAAVMSVGAAALVELQPRGDRRRAAITTTTAYLGGSALGPLVGGILAQTSARAFVAPFVLHLALLAVALGAMLAAGPWRTTEATVDAPAPNGVRRGTYAEGVWLGCLSGLSGVMFLAMIPSYATEVLGLETELLNGVVVAAFLAVGVPVQLAVRGGSPRLTAMIGLLVSVCGLGCEVAAQPTQSALLLVVGGLVVGAGNGACLTGALDLVNRAASSARRTRATAGFYAMLYGSAGLAALPIGISARDGTLFGTLRETTIVYCAFVIATVLAALAARTRAGRFPLGSPPRAGSA